MIAAPKISDVNKVDFLPVEEIDLPNGIKMYVIDAGAQPVCKIDIVFDAGTSLNKSRLLPSSAIALIDDGTSKYSASQLADKIDGKGAFFMSACQPDYAITTLFTLTRFASDLLPLYVEMINDSVFPDEEVELYKARMKQQFLIQNQRVDVLSNQALLNALYGVDGAYSDPTSITDFDNLTRKEIMSFYNTNVKNSPKMIIVSGKIGQELKNLIIKTFGELKLALTTSRTKNSLEVTPPELLNNGIIEIEGNGNSQISMRFGKIALEQKHSDYWSMSLLTTILGGYFGSRLNKVLREEKGLTYGVHSYISHLKESAFLNIHSELNSENREEAYKATISVFDDLKSNKIGKEEMSMVISYVKGSLLKSFDGPFAQANYLLTSKLLGLDINRAHTYYDFLDNVSPDEIKSAAQNYLDENSFYKIIAGV